MDKFVCIHCGNKSFADAKELTFRKFHWTNISYELENPCSECGVGRVMFANADEVKDFYATKAEL